MENKKLQPQITEYLYRKASVKGIPIGGTFELTPRCNLNCKMCYVRMTNQEIIDSGYRERSLEEWIELAKQCRDAGMLFLLLTGGEPFLLDYFKELYLELSKMGFKIKINTNGTMIDENTVEWLKKNPPTKINITVYGASNETYLKLCNNPNGFNQVTNAIKLLKDANIPIRINMTLTQYNVDDIEKIYKFAKENSIEIHTTSYIFPPSRKYKDKFGDGNRMTAKDAAYYEILGEKLKFDTKQFMTKVNIIKKNVEKRIKEIQINTSDELLPISCRAGKCAFWINWKGEMTPCGMMNEPKTNPFDIGFENAWKEILDETKKIFLPQECSNCKFKTICHVCPAVTYTETGEFNKKPNYICDMTRCEYEQLLDI